MRSEWYLQDVKEKENRSWSVEDKIRIYTLRQEKSVAEVAQIFGATAHQIYNITRLMKKGIKAQCYHCGNPLTEEEQTESPGFIKACHKCKEAALTYKRGRRQVALSKGLCGYCEKDPVIPGHTACKKCLSATHRRRNKEGKCGSCGKNPVAHEGGALCQKCIDVSTIKVSIYKKRKNHANAD